MSAAMAASAAEAAKAPPTANAGCLNPEAAAAPWSCEACTFQNKAENNKCEMCAADRPAVAPAPPPPVPVLGSGAAGNEEADKGREAGEACEAGEAVADKAPSGANEGQEQHVDLVSSADEMGEGDGGGADGDAMDTSMEEAEADEQPAFEPNPVRTEALRSLYQLTAVVHHRGKHAFAGSTDPSDVPFPLLPSCLRIHYFFARGDLNHSLTYSLAFLRSCVPGIHVRSRPFDLAGHYVTHVRRPVAPASASSSSASSSASASLSASAPAPAAATATATVAQWKEYDDSLATDMTEDQVLEKSQREGYILFFSSMAPSLPPSSASVEPEALLANPAAPAPPSLQTTAEPRSDPEAKANARQPVTVIPAAQEDMTDVPGVPDEENVSDKEKEQINRALKLSLLEDGGSLPQAAEPLSQAESDSMDTAGTTVVGVESVSSSVEAEP